MNYFQKVLTEFYGFKASKEKKTTRLAELCILRERAKVICYNAPVSLLSALLKQKPARLLAVADSVSKEQRKLAKKGKHMISLEGTLAGVTDRVFDCVVACPETLLTEDLEKVIPHAYRLAKEGGTVLFLGEPQQRMYPDLVKHSLTQAGFGQIRFLSDKDYSCVVCVREKGEEE